jgi:DNA-binding CsgD family transcriptional regulator
MDAELSCVLDVADDGGISDDKLSRILGMTPKQANAVCEGAVRKLRHHTVADILRVFRSST